MEAKIDPENYPTEAAAIEPAADAGAVEPDAADAAVEAQQEETADASVMAQQQVTTATAVPPSSASETSAAATDKLSEATRKEPPVGLDLQESPAGLEAQLAEPPATDSSASPETAAMTAPPDQKPLVVEHLERFEAQLAEHLRNTASCSRAAFDYLYDEMQGYKKNFLREAQHPLLLDLMMLYDSIDKLRRNYEQASSVDAVTLSQNLDALQAEAEEILGRVGIERMSATPEKLDVNLQRAVKTVPTDNPEEHLLVIEQVKSGFVSGDQTLRKEQVVVKKYSSPAPSPGTTAG